MAAVGAAHALASTVSASAPAVAGLPSPSVTSAAAARTSLPPHARSSAAARASPSRSASASAAASSAFRRILCPLPLPLLHPIGPSSLRPRPRHLRNTSHLLRVSAISSNDFRVGTSIELDGAPWRVQEFLHVKPGKGAAFVRTKLKNYISGNTVERTFRAGEQVDEARVVKDVKQYTYTDGDDFVFMDMVSYEETRIGAKELGNKVKFLKEGMDCSVLSWSDKVIDVELPVTLKAKVVQADPGVKGDTASGGGSKPATIETGAVISVPLFISEGEDILVDTRTGAYMGRG